MRAFEGAVYCVDCVAKLTRRASKPLSLRFPASHGRGKGTCRGCEKIVKLKSASKIIRK